MCVGEGLWFPCTFVNFKKFCEFQKSSVVSLPVSLCVSFPFSCTELAKSSLLGFVEILCFEIIPFKLTVALESVGHSVH